MRDFESYWAAGVARTDGDDPYSRNIRRAERAVPGVDATREETLPFVGPPFGLVVWEQFARTGYARAAIVWSAVLGIAFVTLIVGSLALAGGRTGAVEVGAALVLGAAFGPVTSGLALGQVAIVACAANVAALLALRRRNVLAAATAALVAAFQPNVAIAIGAGLGQRRAAMGLVLGAAVAIGGSLVAARGLDGALHYLAVLRDHAAAERFIAIQTTPAAVARAFGLPAEIATAAGLIVALAVLAVLARQCWSRRFNGVERYALAAAALPLAWPFAHEHDFALVFFPAVLTVRRANDRIAPLAALGALLIAVDWLGFAQRPLAGVQMLLLAIAAGLAMALLRPPASAANFVFARTVLGVFSLLLFAASKLARDHPLPIWPDALPAAFTVNAHLPIAAVWALEQHASGIDALDPVWGALRALSLAGCAVLWYAASRTLSAHGPIVQDATFQKIMDGPAAGPRRSSL